MVPGVIPKENSTSELNYNPKNTLRWRYMQLHQMFIQNAKKYNKRNAIVDRTLNRTFSYGKALIAALLLAKKLKPIKENFIGIMLPNSAACILSILGSLISGKIPVMINYSVGAGENAKYAQKKCSFHPIITSKKLLERIDCPPIDGMIFIEDIMEGISKIDKIKAALFSKFPTFIILSKVYRDEDHDDALILFTSGSEKLPKAVELTHKSIMSNVWGVCERLQINENDSFLSILPFFHIFGQTATFWLPIYSGTSMVTYHNPLEYKTVVEIIREEKVTFLLATPAFYMGYLRQAKQGDFDSVRIAVAGADKTPDWLREKFINEHNLTLFEGYGTTETSPVISVNIPCANRPGSVGQPLPGVEVKIADINTGESLPPNQEGKIMVKGDLVMKGYYDDIEETSLRIVNGWYETGDMEAGIYGIEDG